MATPENVRKIIDSARAQNEPFLSTLESIVTETGESQQTAAIWLMNYSALGR